MQTIREGKIEDIHISAFKSLASYNPSLANPEKRLKQREYISWSICFGIISFLTGLLKFLKVGVTMDSVTSILFYLSLVGVFYFVYKSFSLSKNNLRGNSNTFHGLN
jgi:hypothetical protein